jgi:spore coat polysaccharide biosynthesis protein SpsF
MTGDKRCAIVLARYSSSRFPGKALYPICGKTLLEWCLYFLKISNGFDTILATSTHSTDDPLQQLAESMEVKCFRGDLDDVYKRVVDCIEFYKIDTFARINGDSPFPQTSLIESAFGQLEMSDLDFVTNLYPRTFPYGISVEVFRATTFCAHYPMLDTADQHEHITSYFYTHSNHFKYKNLTSDTPVKGDVRLVVDTKEDLPLIEKLLKNPAITSSPDFKTINRILND